MMKFVLAILLATMALVHGADVNAQVGVGVGVKGQTTATPANPSKGTPATIASPAPVTEKNGKTPKPPKTPKTKPPTTPKPTPTPKGTTQTPKGTTTTTGTTTKGNGKSQCATCKAFGPDCKPDGPKQSCDFCAKITGKIAEKSQVPNVFMDFIGRVFGVTNLSGEIKAHKGEQVTFKTCVSKALITLAGQKFNEPGCHTFDQQFMGLDNANACLCDGECTAENTVSKRK